MDRKSRYLPLAQCLGALLKARKSSLIIRGKKYVVVGVESISGGIVSQAQNQMHHSVGQQHENLKISASVNQFKDD